MLKELGYLDEGEVDTEEPTGEESTTKAEQKECHNGD